MSSVFHRVPLQAQRGPAQLRRVGVAAWVGLLLALVSSPAASAQEGTPADGLPAGLPAGLRILYEVPMQSFRLRRSVFLDLWRQWPRGPARDEAQGLAGAPGRDGELLRLVAQRYGLPLDPRRGSDVPAAFAVPPIRPGAEEPEWTMNCLVCHGGEVGGRYHAGLPNSGLLLESFVRDIVATKRGMDGGLQGSLPIGPQGHTIGLTEATLFGDVLLRFREPNMDLKDLPGLVRAGSQAMSQIAALPEGLLSLDAPAWWQLKHKTHLYLDHSAAKNHRTVMQFTLGVEDPKFKPKTQTVVVNGDREALARAVGQVAAGEILKVRERYEVERDGKASVVRVEDFLQHLTQAVPSMPFIAQLALSRHLEPSGIPGETIRSWDDEFQEIFAFIDGLEAPRYPGTVNETLAEEGRALFHRTCARCHGHQDGSGPAYESRRIDLDVIGTDAVYPTALDQSFRDRLVGFLTEGPDGEQVNIATDAVADQGYVAPPLEGVWATAPYLHNGSVPTVDALLDHGARMDRVEEGVYAWTADPESYDHDAMGLSARFLSREEADQRRGDHTVHDSRRRGASAAGHDFGEALSGDERRAIIEYLKTL